MQLATLANMSVAQIERYFRKIFHLTPRQMLLKARLDAIGTAGGRFEHYRHRHAMRLQRSQRLYAPVQGHGGRPAQPVSRAAPIDKLTTPTCRPHPRAQPYHTNTG